MIREGRLRVTRMLAQQKWHLELGMASRALKVSSCALMCDIVGVLSKGMANALAIWNTYTHKTKRRSTLQTECIETRHARRHGGMGAHQTIGSSGI